MSQIGGRAGEGRAQEAGENGERLRIIDHLCLIVSVSVSTTLDDQDGCIIAYC